MDAFLFPVLKMIVATLLLTGGALAVIRYYFSFRQPVVAPSVTNEDQQVILPLRLQACERLVLFLDRISIGNLILRLNRTDMTALQLQAAMVSTVREEFDYNLSQQLYISSKSWNLVRNAKEETIKLINTASMKVDAGAPATDMIRLLLDLSLADDKPATEIAMEAVKGEIRRPF
jgi:hypothetical protein